MKQILLLSTLLFIGSSIFAQTGNVGVGTTNPQQRLDVAGWVGLGNQTEGTTGTAGAIRYHSVSKTIQYYDGTTWIDLLPASAAGDDDWTLSGNNMHNANTGNVAIGTTSYTEKFNVVGDVYIAGSGTTIGLSNVANGALRIGSSLGLDNNEIMFDVQANIGTVGAQDLVFLTNGSGRVTISGTGNVNIASLSNGIVKADGSGNLSVTTLTGSTSDVLLGNGTFGPSPATGDNLGNHSATTTLDMNNHQITAISYANIRQVDGSGIRFWSSDSYKISMGNSSEYHYGPVTDYSIRTNMNSTSGRGWTWGISGSTTVAGLSNAGHMQIAGDMTVAGADIYVGTTAKRIYSTSDDIRIGSTTGYIDIVPGDGTHGLIMRDYTGNSSDWTGARHVNNGTNDRFEFNVGNGGYGQGLVLMQNDRVGIGTTNPGYSLHVAGKIKSDGITETSDIRLKTNINPIEGALSKLLQLRGVNYNWRVDEFPELRLETGTDIGVIAQEVQVLFPEVVNTDDEGYLSVEYSHLVPVLIEAIKEQQKIIDGLNAEVGGNTALINSLQTQLNQLQEQLEVILPNGKLTTNK